MLSTLPSIPLRLDRLSHRRACGWLRRCSGLGRWRWRRQRWFLLHVQAHLMRGRRQRRVRRLLSCLVIAGSLLEVRHRLGHERRWALVHNKRLRCSWRRERRCRNRRGQARWMLRYGRQLPVWRSGPRKVHGRQRPPHLLLPSLLRQARLASAAPAASLAAGTATEAAASATGNSQRAWSRSRLQEGLDLRDMRRRRGRDRHAAQTAAASLTL